MPALTLTQMWKLAPAPTALRPDRLTVAQPAELPPASEEQRLIVEAVRGDRCVRITAYAGTGKTTTAMIVVCSDAKTNLILTYNRALADETNATIRKLKLTNVACRTYHAQVGIAAGMRGQCSNDAKMLQILRHWDAGVPVASPISEDRVLLDEVQDMRPSFYRAVMHMVAPGRQMLVLGDENQMLYDYGEDDAARLDYLQRPDVHFLAKTCERRWVSRTLSTSYRLTPKVAEFVNLLWGIEIVAGNTRSDLPVEYWCLNTYDPTLLRRLREVFASERAEDVAMLTPVNLHSADGKERPLQHVVNQLLLDRDADGRRKYNFAVKKPDAGTSAYKNKIRAWTHNASKGCTIGCTIVLGMSAYRGRQPKKNQLGVAISRSNRRLIVVHECDKDGVPHPYCEPLNGELLTQLVERGVVVAQDGIPTDTVEAPPPPEPETISVTSITHLSAATIERMLRYGTDTARVEATHEIEVALTHEFHTGRHATEEDVSPIYGIAIPFAMEYARTRCIPLVESMVSNPILVNGSMLYGPDQVVALLRQARVAMTLDETNAVLAAFQSQSTRGTTVIDTLRDLRRRHRFLSRACVCERRRFDKIFAEHHLQRVDHIYYHTPDKGPSDFMYLANAYIAAEGTHELFVQIGDDYAWVDESAFARAVSVLLERVPHGEYERSACAPIDPPIHGERVIVDGLAGALDVQVDDLTAYELKFVRELTCEHELQALLYAALLAIAAGAQAQCVLLNARTGEAIEKTIEPSAAARLVRDAAQAKAGA